MGEKPASILEQELDLLLLTDPTKAASGEEAWARLNAIHALHHFATSSDLPRKNPGLDLGFSRLLSHTRGLYDFLEESQETEESVGQNWKAMLFGTGSSLTGGLEEFLTGEDPFEDVLFNVLPFLLSRLSEQGYVNSAKVAVTSLYRQHSLYLYEGLWDLVKHKGLEEKGTEGLRAAQKASLGLAGLRTLLLSDQLNDTQRQLFHVLFYTILINEEVRRMVKLLE